MNQLQVRTKRFAIEICRFVKQARLDFVDQVLARQIVRSATSIGANHRAAQRARSTADMIAKLKIVEEEADETCFWLEILREIEDRPGENLAILHRECEEILAMTVASLKTLRSRPMDKSRAKETSS